MQPFFDATPLLDDPAALAARFALDGYVFLRGQADPDVLRAVHGDVCTILSDAGWLLPGSSPTDAISDRVPTVEGEPDYFLVYDQIQKLESFHALPHHQSVLSVMQRLLGPTAFPHPLSIMRLVFPDNDDWATPPHQDFPNNQGTADLLACWMPLTDCPAERGSLSILAGSNQLGLIPLKFSLGAGNFGADLDQAPNELTWVGGDFALGDMVIFHSHTVHRSMPNATSHLRLSADYRFQREGEPLTSGCLEPHFGRSTWDAIYADWSSSDLQYYWNDKQFSVVDFDTTLHSLDDEANREANRVRFTYDVQRAQLAKRRKWDSMPEIDQALNDLLENRARKEGQ